MIPFRLIFLVLSMLAVACSESASAQGESDLLLPFPAEAAVDSTTARSEASVSERSGPAAGRHKAENTRRALELAETFIRRQQLEVTNSVPRREPQLSKLKAENVPVGSSASAVFAASGNDPAALGTPEFGSSGPSSELLPLPGNDSLGAPLDTILPDASAMLPATDAAPGEFLPDTGGGTESEVPRTDLAPAPAYGGVEDQDRRGPVFRVPGPQAFAVARARGFKFTPAGGIGARDGSHTAASQFPNLLTSEVHSTRMSQLRPPATWSVAETSNTFFMFCDAHYNAVRLAPGWRIRGIKLDGPNWRWVACPRSGANTASFSIRIHSFKGQEAATSVQLSALTLEGPDGATDWKEAFPWINGRGPLQQSPPAAQPGPSAVDAYAGAAAPSGEPPLPR